MPEGRKFVIFFSLGSSYHEGLTSIKAQIEHVITKYSANHINFVPVDTAHWRTNAIHKIYQVLNDFDAEKKDQWTEKLNNPETRKALFARSYALESDAGQAWRTKFQRPIENFIEEMNETHQLQVACEFQNWYDIDADDEVFSSIDFSDDKTDVESITKDDVPKGDVPKGDAPQQIVIGYEKKDRVKVEGIVPLVRGTSNNSLSSRTSTDSPYTELTDSIAGSPDNVSFLLQPAISPPSDSVIDVINDHDPLVDVITVPQLVYKFLYHNAMKDYLTYRLQVLSVKISAEAVGSEHKRALETIFNEYEDQLSNNQQQLTFISGLDTVGGHDFSKMLGEYPVFSTEAISALVNNIDEEASSYNLRQENRLKGYDVYSLNPLVRWVIRLSIEYVLKCCTVTLTQSLVYGVHGMYYPRKTGCLLKYMTKQLSASVYESMPETLKVEQRHVNWAPLTIHSKTNYQTISEARINAIKDAVSALVTQYNASDEGSKSVERFCKQHGYDRNKVLAVLTFWTGLTTKTSITADPGSKKLVVEINKHGDNTNVNDYMQTVMLMILNMMNHSSAINREILVTITRHVIGQFDSLMDDVLNPQHDLTQRHQGKAHVESKVVEDVEQTDKLSRVSMFIQRLDFEDDGLLHQYHDAIELLDREVTPPSSPPR